MLGLLIGTIFFIGIISFCIWSMPYINDLRQDVVTSFDATPSNHQRDRPE